MEFITDNFELLTQKSDSIDQVKQLVLDLAVRGLLVPQIEEEGDAATIIQRSNDLENKVNQSSKKKKKTSTPISHAEQPFDLPSSWAFVRLGDVFNTTSGGTPTRGVPEYWDGDIPWLKSGELNDGIITDLPSEYITPEGLKNSSAKLFPKGSLVIALYGATAGKLGVLDYETTSNQAVCAFFENPFISTEYLFFYLLAFRSKIVQDSWGQAQPNISQTYLKNFSFALPPIEEQHRIVQKVNTLFQQIDRLAESSDQAEHTRARLRRVLLHRLEQAPTQLETEKAWLPLQDQFDLAIRTVEDVQALRQTILQLAVKGALVVQDPEDEPASVLLKRIKKEKDRLVKEGKIRKEEKLPPISEEEKQYELPNGWEWCRLNEICKVITDGTHQTPKYTESGSMFISAKNVKPFKFMPEECKYVSEADYQGYIKNRKPDYQDILLTRVGSNIGEAAKIDQEIDFAIYVSVALIKIFKGLIDPDYLVIWLNSPSGTEKSIRFTYGRGMSQGNLNLGLIRNFVISLPPLPEQKRIVTKVEQLLGWCDELESQIREKKEKGALLEQSALQLSN